MDTSQLYFAEDFRHCKPKTLYSILDQLKYFYLFVLLYLYYVKIYIRILTWLNYFSGPNKFFKI